MSDEAWHKQTICNAYVDAQLRRHGSRLDDLADAFAVDMHNCPDISPIEREVGALRSQVDYLLDADKQCTLKICEMIQDIANIPSSTIAEEQVQDHDDRIQELEQTVEEQAKELQLLKRQVKRLMAAAKMPQ